MTDGLPKVRLGKAPPKRYYGDIAIKLADHLDLPKALPSVKPSQTWGGGIHFGMFLNDRLPDCTLAAPAHGNQIHSTRTGRAERLTDDAIMDAFHATGIEQGLGDDDGRYMLGILGYLIRIGLEQADGTYEKILGYAAVNHLSHEEVMVGSQYFGGLYFGAALPLSAANQINEHKSWTVSKDPSLNAPGGWGGHAMWNTGWNSRGPRSATWARPQQMNWSWWDKYVDECYVIVTPDWVRNEFSPSGLRKHDLLDLFAEINR